MNRPFFRALLRNICTILAVSACNYYTGNLIRNQQARSSSLRVGSMNIKRYRVLTPGAAFLLSGSKSAYRGIFGPFCVIFAQYFVKEEC